MNFNTKGHDIFRRWYVDGRIFYQKIIDRNSTQEGITELRYIDPRKIKRIREVRKKRPDGVTDLICFLSLMILKNIICLMKKVYQLNIWWY